MRRFKSLARCGVVFLVAMACLGLDCQGNMPAGLPASALSTGIVRLVLPGDFAVYDERRELFENGQQLTIVGTTRSLVLGRTITDFAGNEARISTITADLVRQDTQVPTTSVAQLYFSQDADGTVYIHGLLDDTVNPPERRFVKVPAIGKVLSTPSPIRLGTIVSVDVEYTDGTTETGSATAVAIEQVLVPAGWFVAVRVEGSATVTSGMRTKTVSYTSWVVPALGISVRAESTTSVREGSALPIFTLTTVSELRETNIPY